MQLQLNKDSAVPLYHQIAEAIQYQIATGRLAPGQALPTLRGASASWGVNLHTVGRAYRELAARGLVESRGRSGTRVLRSALSAECPGATGAPVAAFLQRTLVEARAEHGLGAEDLARLLLAGGEAARPRLPTVHVLECSEHQARGHSRELEARWSVRALPWSLSWTGEPPPGPLVATYFHYHEIRRRWPDRREDLRFVAIQPDPDLRTRLEARGATRSEPIQLCELDEPKARNTVAELALLLPPERFDLRPRVVERAGELLDGLGSGSLVLFPPRVWAALSDQERAHSSAIPLRFFLEPGEIEAIGGELGWRARAPGSAA